MEGISFISHLYPDYDIDKLYDETNHFYYSFPMIYPIIHALDFRQEFFEMLLFDALIGNSDRHHSNWAILVSEDCKYKFCPLYDNGSSLCCYINESNIDDYLYKDELRFSSLVTTKSKSRIRIDQFIKKEPSHKEVLTYLKLQREYNQYCIPMVNKICRIITQQNINKIINEYPDDVLSSKKKRLICKFLERKVTIIAEIFKGGS